MVPVRRIRRRTNAICRASISSIVALDPGYAKAWVQLSGAYRVMAWTDDHSADWRERQRDAAMRAVELAPGSAEAHVRLGRYYFETSDRDKAVEHFRRTSVLAPVERWLAGAAAGWTRWDEDFDLAWDVELEISRILVAQGRYDDAYAPIMQLPEGEARDSGLMLLYHDPGRRSDSDAALTRLVARPGDAMHGVRVAEAYAFRDVHDEAFAWLQRTRDGLERDHALLARIWEMQNNMYLSPFLEPLHADARWADLMSDPG